jgi:hypothetical protein
MLFQWPARQASGFIGRGKRGRYKPLKPQQARAVRSMANVRSRPRDEGRQTRLAR